MQRDGLPVRVALLAPPTHDVPNVHDSVDGADQMQRSPIQSGQNLCKDSRPGCMRRDAWTVVLEPTARRRLA
eukprot:15374057-Alexandrium_andersonii.AAC.1